MPRKRDQRASNKAYYAANRVEEIKRVRRRQDAIVAFLRDLRNVPCADCGGRFEPHQMDFDHRDPNTKAFDVCSSSASLKSHGAIALEAAKCDIVCANCHRLRSRRQHRDRLAKHSLSMSGKTPAHRERWRRNADLLDQLRSVPCGDCGNRYPQCCMDFDHRDPDQKVKRVPAMIASHGIGKILAEVAKCDIVCANCHRLRTFYRRAKQAA
jgi:hypothetical protein